VISRAVLLLAVLAASPTLAAQEDAAESVEDFVVGCATVLMAPDKLPDFLKAAGFEKAGEMSLRPTIDVTAYAKDGGKRLLIVNRQRYADATATNCQVSGLFGSSEEGLGSLRAKLETQAPIGKLDGEIYRVPQSSIFASFKRLGNDPVLTIQATATAQSTVLTMTRWDFKAGR